MGDSQPAIVGGQAEQVLCAGESESSSATLSGQVKSTAGALHLSKTRVKVVAQAQGEIKELVVERGSEAFCI